ncbi:MULTISPECIES: serine/threonine protein phosphatase [unclassified Ruminococcus]|uniref:serine/threonine protein phosphatase n=1 Tax=unclassified Ruminococcus TaxID=2608920 RepID=UPI001FA74B1D|nr:MULTISPECIES: serine/threonine protein phosphatase [unclassified Ruminococcus]
MLLTIFRKNSPAFMEVTSGAERNEGFRVALGTRLLEEGLYEELRRQVPVIDAAITKLVRLTGGFNIVCEDKAVEEELRRFFDELPVSISGRSLDTFTQMYLDSLLTYGRAIGEILVSENTRGIAGLYCADCTHYRVRHGNDGIELTYTPTGDRVSLPDQNRLLYTALNPSPKNPSGNSLLRGLPVFGKIITRIFRTVGQNFERAGNVRYAVTYKPSGEGDAQFAKERAQEIARQWSDGMAASKCGSIKDFVAVGDVQIKVIGADGVILDTNVPVRQILEQMVSKLSIPPFMLGLSWSTTERMSSQQADILTSEIDYYRRLLTQVMMRIIRLHCAMRGIDEKVDIVWDNVNLQDEESLARARLYNAQAAEIEERLKGGMA